MTPRSCTRRSPRASAWAATTPHGGKAAASLRAAASQVCAECHETDPTALRKDHRGFPVAGTDCASCHAPHASDLAGLPHATRHAPYEDGDCTDCHVAGKVTLVQAQPALCFECHPGLAEELKVGTPHGPLATGDACTVCHAPHTTARADLIPRAQEAVCGQCHSDQVASRHQAEYVHPDQDGRTCSMCHDPHLTAPTRDSARVSRDAACLACHSYSEHTDHPVGADYLDPRTGEPMFCGSCHRPHGSNYPKFLEDDPQGRLCVDCHTDKLREKRR